MELLQNYALDTNGVTAIYLDSLPNTYNKIVVEAELQDHSSNPNSIGNVSFRVNGVTTNYAGAYFGHQGNSTNDSTVYPANTPNGLNPMVVPRTGVGYDSRNTIWLELPNYNDVTHYNHVIWNTGYFNNSGISSNTMGHWTAYAYHASTTSAITSIAFFSQYGFRKDSQIRVYGV